jgi:hypothetical protein
MDNVIFLIGDSIINLNKIALNHPHIHFAFLDSAPSAMHTFCEFQSIKKCLKTDSCILIDNAAFTNAKLLLSRCRKGKILIPFLLASPNWVVHAYPNAGDSMISAIYHNEPNYADHSYELSGYDDPWKSYLKKIQEMY